MRVLNIHNFGVAWPAGAVNIMRPGPWGNPFAGPRRAQNIAKFEAWLRTQPELIRRAFLQLKGNDLVCACAPKPCHGDVWVKILAEARP